MPRLQVTVASVDVSWLVHRMVLRRRDRRDHNQLYPDKGSRNVTAASRAQDVAVLCTHRSNGGRSANVVITA